MNRFILRVVPRFRYRQKPRSLPEDEADNPANSSNQIFLSLFVKERKYLNLFAILFLHSRLLIRRVVSLTFEMKEGRYDAIASVEISFSVSKITVFIRLEFYTRRNYSLYANISAELYRSVQMVRKPRQILR